MQRLASRIRALDQPSLHSSLTAQLASVVCVSLRLISLSAQRFLFNVAEDAQQVSRLRTRQPGEEGQRSSELTMDDLTVALSYQGIQVSKPAYYADHLDTQ